MINLIKCELIKMFHKKIFIVMAIITILFASLLFVLNKSQDNLNNILVNTYVGLEGDSIDKIDMNDPSNREYYAESKADYEIYKYEVSNDCYYNWKSKILDDKGIEILTKAYLAEFDKDTELYEQYMEEYKKLLEDLENNDWKYFANMNIVQLKNDIASYEEEVKLSEKYYEELSSQLDNLNKQNEIEKDIEKDEIKGLEEEIRNTKENIRYLQKLIYDSTIDLEALEFRIKYDIPFQYSGASSLVDEYVELKSQYNEANKDEESYKNYDSLKKFRELKSSFLVSEYKLKNGYLNGEYDSSQYNVISLVSYSIFFVTIFTAIVSGSIMADEFNKGTIKQLLIKPYTRSKIFISKLIASFIMFLIYYLFYNLVYLIVYGLLFDFKSYFDPVILYNFNLDKVVEVNFFKHCLMNFVCILPFYVIVMLFSYTLSIITCNAAVAIGGGFALSFGGEIVNALALHTNKKIVAFLPTLCWDLTPYLYGGLHSYKYCTFVKSLSVDIFCIVILFIIGLIVFKKINIKNQ